MQSILSEVRIEAVQNDLGRQMRKLLWCQQIPFWRQQTQLRWCYLRADRTKTRFSFSVLECNAGRQRPNRHQYDRRLLFHELSGG